MILTAEEIKELKDKTNDFLNAGHLNRISNGKLAMMALSKELDHLQLIFEINKIQSLEIVNKKLKINKDEKLPK